ncbi:MAG: hypothetical protein AAF581_10270 [Planctomycetota bacterium]
MTMDCDDGMSRRAGYILLAVCLSTVLVFASLTYLAPQESVRIDDGAVFSCCRFKVSRLPQRVEIVDVRWSACYGTSVMHTVAIDAVEYASLFYGPRGEIEAQYGDADVRLAEHEVIEAIQWAEDYVRSAHARGECELPRAWCEAGHN